MTVSVQEADFAVGAEIEALGAGTDNAGAVASFVGMVRGGEILAMTLEHYPGMTEKALAEIVAEARRRWALLGVRVIHRVGRLLPGERIVFVAVSSTHRLRRLRIHHGLPENAGAILEAGRHRLGRPLGGCPRVGRRGARPLARRLAGHAAVPRPIYFFARGDDFFAISLRLSKAAREALLIWSKALLALLIACCMVSMMLVFCTGSALKKDWKASTMSWLPAANCSVSRRENSMRALLPISATCCAAAIIFWVVSCA